MTYHVEDRCISKINGKLAERGQLDLYPACGTIGKLITVQVNNLNIEFHPDVTSHSPPRSPPWPRPKRHLLEI
jgi:hypothetical protein